MMVLVVEEGGMWPQRSEKGILSHKLCVTWLQSQVFDSDMPLLVLGAIGMRVNCFKS